MAYQSKKISSSCLINTGIMKMSGFYNFFCTLWKIFVFPKNYSTDFQIKSFIGKSAHYPMRLHNSLVSFYLTLLPTAFEKVSGGIFYPNFWVFYLFSKNARPNLRFWVQRIEQVGRNSLAEAATPKFFLHKNLWPSEKSNFFRSFFSIFF